MVMKKKFLLLIALGAMAVSSQSIFAMSIHEVKNMLADQTDAQLLLTIALKVYQDGYQPHKGPAVCDSLENKKKFFAFLRKGVKKFFKAFYKQVHPDAVDFEETAVKDYFNGRSKGSFRFAAADSLKEFIDNLDSSFCGSDVELYALSIIKKELLWLYKTREDLRRDGYGPEYQKAKKAVLCVGTRMALALYCFSYDGTQQFGGQRAA